MNTYETKHKKMNIRDNLVKQMLAKTDQFMIYFKSEAELGCGERKGPCVTICLFELSESERRLKRFGRSIAICSPKDTPNRLDGVIEVLKRALTTIKKGMTWLYSDDETVCDTCTILSASGRMPKEDGIGFPAGYLGAEITDEEKKMMDDRKLRLDKRSENLKRCPEMTIEIPKEINHVHARDGAWWFWDETYDHHGPYKTRECAEKALKVYTDTVLGPPPSATKASEKQPPPTGNGLTILPLVLADIQERAQAGLKKYGTLLRAYNGRDGLWDAYQEAIDLVMYLRQDIEERNQVLQRVDWDMLSEQKLAVVEYLLSSGKDGGPSIPAKLDNALNGLVNFLDNLQDQGEKAGLWVPETEKEEAE